MSPLAGKPFQGIATMTQKDLGCMAAPSSSMAVMQGAAMIEEEERRVRESGGQDYDMLLKNNIEGIIIKWAYQVGLSFEF